MTWKKIKTEITRELNNPERDLAKPQIRTRALDSVERLLKEVLLAQPQLLLKLEKKNLVKALMQLKKLNGAEKSVINHIYNVLAGEPIPAHKKKRDG